MVETQDVMVGATSRKRLSGRRLKFLIGGLVIALVAGYLIFSAAQGSAAFYLTIQEIEQQGPSARNVRVAGNVVGESIVWEARDLRLEFDIVDESGRLPVVYSGSRPDMFRDEAEVVVEGKLGPEGTFEARTMLLKCPSKYEEE
jgi:cytochrome c-type biogenesis protein CcmE